ncbi:MAG: hypothetical protein J5641_02500, partial [Bacteroidales bacterium]|nr:hypothetical protein [Bacteroidales bacterium]
NNGIISLSNISTARGSFCLGDDTNDAEKKYFNILLKCILNTMEKSISEHRIIKLIEESAKIFKNTPLAETRKGELIIKSLREYWAYKTQRTDYFEIPEELPIFQAVMSFFIKPLGFDQIERFMLIKNYSQKCYAFMLWGAWVGFADMPKTFTNVLFQNEGISHIIEELIQ